MTARAARVDAVLRERFGLARLRPGQRAVIERVLRGQPTLAVMPTGAGKSLCYQLPALLLRGCTLVVSPLIALMKDQCESLRALGIEAVELNSAIGTQAQREAEAAVAQGRARIVMATPERLAEPGFLALLKSCRVSLAVVDEAHCISQWGHDFRPAFLEIGPVLARLRSKPTVLALTATAADDVARDICAQLRIPEDGRIDTGAYRPNLDLRVETVAREADKLARALDIVRGETGSGIVYAATVKAAGQVHEALLGAGESAGLYHGRLPAAERHAAQEAFMAGAHRVMVATNAFGLGIDKPDIRFVLHYQVPATLEAYYQEAGRAGRDGQAAHCTLVFLRGDKSIQQFFLVGRYPTAGDALALFHALAEPPPGGEAWTLALLQGRLARPKAKLQVVLGWLKRRKLVVQGEDGSLRLARADVGDAMVDELARAYEARRAQDRESLERMVFYAQTGQCRWRVLLDQLEGEAPFERCGHCDNCRLIAAQQAEVDAVLRARQPDTDRAEAERSA